MPSTISRSSAWSSLHSARSSIFGSSSASSWWGYSIQVAKSGNFGSVYESYSASSWRLLKIIISDSARIMVHRESRVFGWFRFLSVSQVMVMEIQTLTDLASQRSICHLPVRRQTYHGAGCPCPAKIQLFRAQCEVRPRTPVQGFGLFRRISLLSRRPTYPAGRARRHRESRGWDVQPHFAGWPKPRYGSHARACRSKPGFRPQGMRSARPSTRT